MNKNDDAFDVSVDDAFDFLSEEYATLFEGSDATAFQHPLWLDNIYRKLAPAAAAKPLIVVVRHRMNNALAAVFPMLRVRRGPMRVIEFADLRVSDYLSPVCSIATFARLLQDQRACATLRQLLRPFDLLRIPKLLDARMPVENLLGAPHRSLMDMNAYATVLTAPFEQWQINALGKSYQKELAKKWRQIHKKGTLTFSCCDNGASVGEAMETMRKFRGPRFHEQGDGDLLQRPEYFDFYSSVALRGLGSFTRLYAMKMDGEVIATALGLAHRDTLLVVMTAFNVEGYKSQSIGALTFESVAKDCIERGCRALDFTIGDEPYKMQFGGQPTPMSAVTQAGSAAGSLALFALKQAPWIKQAAKRLTDLRPIRTSTGTR
ncbi:GNAT family N-acetyltransferase [Bradyrhizobium uaiense]|uniref:GNAT family N-acetyltransferase n=1 Tax=Bradyrhizobium uaiense TaxID=2594946 RepID=A0A6P1B7K1_9BRAD|nr:GNAT family N-acetyltransferase [Bradyrhizobium uaiense]NEU94459.1 GNAT family N-acetyltransferase [Bradyrhizobium uaiense]